MARGRKAVTWAGAMDARNEDERQWREGERGWGGSHKITRGWKPGMRTRDSGERAKEGGVVVIRL